MVTCLEMMQTALPIMDRWCDGEGLAVNPSKTVMISFTSRRYLEITQPYTQPHSPTHSPTVLCGGQIQVSREFKYLEVKLDDTLTWNNHMEYINSRSHTTMMMVRRVVGYT
ncbi:uncharacterized protein LOC124368469 [Homalodisca vitripennis]|uniref:uncharacterized protein LOC124368469 n=1 Tax=Homalodisca vitripennis TaxID=197043 RepID=UPI001EEBAEAD|nr:uncharacterized protein LOC124368469 [Homalodisca vitripennis]